MKRDFDLVRRILLDIENVPAARSCDYLEYPGEYDQPTVYGHIDLLMKEGYVNGKTHPSGDSIDAFHITGLTWKGHDFIDAAKDPSIWDKAKQKLFSSTVSITFDILLEWLKFQAKEKLKLP